jgi:hypothetical protein
MSRLEEIKARVEKATDGPWQLVYRSDGFGAFKGRMPVAWFHGTTGDSVTERPNAEFIAHAREDIPWLIAQKEADMAEIARLREAFAGLKKTWQWLEQLRSEPDRDDDAIEQAHGAFHDTLDYAISLADPEWTQGYLARVRAGNKALKKKFDDQKAEIARLRDVVGQLSRTRDDVPYLAYGDTRTFYAVWRHEESEPWAVSACHVPQDTDELALDFDWIIEDAEDECEVDGVYSTRAAAEAARKEDNDG